MTRVFECTDCGRRTFYEKQRCPDCAGDAFRTCEPGVGTIEAVTVAHVTPDTVREPNRLGLASFDGDASIITQIDETLEVGDSVLVEAPADTGTEQPALVPASESDRDRLHESRT